jgi:hypothetical protein
MDAAKHDPALSRKAGNYLGEQLALVRLQVRHFDKDKQAPERYDEALRYAPKWQALRQAVKQKG